LPEAGSAGVTSEGEIRLETKFTSVVTALSSVTEGQRRGDLARVVGSSREASALEEDLQEDLRVEGERGGIERSGIKGGVDLVSTCNAVGGQKGDNLEGREVASISKALQDGGHIL
jgi:hypothetical protein